jgi:hypothetical protein
LLGHWWYMCRCLCLIVLLLLLHACRCLDKGAQFVLLGSGHCDGEFKAMAEQQFRDHKDIRCVTRHVT